MGKQATLLSGQNFRFFVPKQQVLLCLNQKSCYLENTSKLKPGAFKSSKQSACSIFCGLKAYQ
jgi:hypothetical protein